MPLDELEIRSGLFAARALLTKAREAWVSEDWRGVGRATREAMGALEAVNRLAVSLVAAEQERAIEQPE